jgi:hypothetical protein
MKITIETDAKGETFKTKIFEHVTQCIVAGSLIREKIAPAIFRHCLVDCDPERINDMIGVATAIAESLRDLKRRNEANGRHSSVS